MSKCGKDVVGNNGRGAGNKGRGRKRVQMRGGQERRKQEKCTYRYTQNINGRRYYTLILSIKRNQRTQKLS